MHKSKPQSRNPSFSSTLLDEIYNSIDPKTQKAQSFVGSVNTTKKQSIVTRSVPDRKIHRDRFFGSVSSSSDSSSSIFSSSDTELTHEDKTLFHQNRATRVSADYDYASDVPKITRYDENWENHRIRRSTKSSKKPKTPASPAGRIVNFINSLFSNNSKQSTTSVKSYPRKTSYDDSSYVRKPNDYHHHPSTCSSATSFSRSCLNKNSEKSSDRIKRSVRFSPVNVIVPEIRSFVEEEDYFSNVRKSVKKSVEVGGRRSVEEIAREFLRDYHHKNHENNVGNNHHNLYGDELPVYETTFASLIL
ncbi:unnamed protein product [Arabis nemorensis]|uniref:Uncharacterized protein n=1 Tax=Arabis nemorensis TaxID=586526 RepID=A0A565CKU0_9BRAS|nr:unnamed protein product [Arabis nemorensis]